METRAIQTQLEAPEEGRLCGYAAVFDSPTQIRERGRTFTEVIRRGAFSRAIKEGQDILCCLHHDEGRLLGRTSSGTLTLKEDIHGLRFEVQLPESEVNLRELVRRGDLREASFRFECKKDRWNGNNRELLDVNLVHLAVVARPAYEDTSLSLRSKETWKMRNDLLRKSLPD